MRNHGLVVAGLLIASTSRLFAYDEKVDALITAVLGGVPAVAVPCGGVPEGAGPMTRRVCAQASVDFEAFQEAWDRRVSGDATLSIAPKPVTDWVTGINGWIRWYSIGGTWLVVAFDKADRRVSLSYPKHREGVFAIGPGMTPPRRITQEVPPSDAISEARGGLKPGAQGVVVLSAVVRKDGAVSDVEVLGSLPARRGLEQAAVRMLKKWRYDPAKINGDAVDAAMNATISFGAAGSYRASEGADYIGAGGGAGAGGGQSPSPN